MLGLQFFASSRPLVPNDVAQFFISGETGGRISINHIRHNKSYSLIVFVELLQLNIFRKIFKKIYQQYKIYFYLCKHFLQLQNHNILKLKKKSWKIRN